MEWSVGSRGVCVIRRELSPIMPMSGVTTLRHFRRLLLKDLLSPFLILRLRFIVSSLRMARHDNHAESRVNLPVLLFHPYFCYAFFRCVRVYVLILV